MRDINGKLETIDERPALRFERRLSHPIERVWRAITEPDELEAWVVARAEWTPAVGETFEAMEQPGEVTEVDRPRVLAWTWGGELFRFELSEHDSGCLLAFTHVFDRRKFGAQHATGWELTFDRLEALLAGGDVRRSIEYGSALGASCVRAAGATTGVFTGEELETFLEENTLAVERI